MRERESSAAVTSPDDQARLSNLLAVRSDLTRRLVAWSVFSLLAGTALWTAGGRRGSRVAVGVGRQAVAWGAVDLAIAAAGHRANRRPVETPVAVTRSLQRLLVINSCLDVGYLGVAAALSSRPRLVGDALGVGIQATALLVLDTWHAWRLRT